MIKTCMKCKEDKDISLFQKQKNNKSGYTNRCKKCHSDYMTNYYKSNPSKYAEKVRMNTFYKPAYLRHKIDEEFYLKLFNLHDGKCHACKSANATNVDHNHECCDSPRSCGKCVRGLLCHGCNTALGLLKDKPENIKNLLEYILK